MTRFAIRAATCLILGAVLAAGVIWVVFGRDWESSYHLHQLDRLNRQGLKVTNGGYAIDDTREEAAVHRDRLTELGVFFTKEYELSSLSLTRAERKRLIFELERSFPENRYWELRNDDVLQVWDYAERELSWDRFIDVEVPSLLDERNFEMDTPRTNSN